MTMVQIGAVSAFSVEPTGEVRGGLILIHEIWGLADHIKDVACRFAEQGYLVLAPDLLSGIGITPEVGEELTRLRASGQAERTVGQPNLREIMAPIQAPEYVAWAVPTLVSVVDELAADERVAGRIGVTGFCFGGSYSFALAQADGRIRACVPFYGAPPQLDKVGDISCPVLAFYGDTDSRLVEGLPEVTAAMSDASVTFTAKVYPDVGHAFFNDTNPDAYDAGSAADAWRLTLAFLAQNLGRGQNQR